MPCTLSSFLTFKGSGHTVHWGSFDLIRPTTFVSHKNAAINELCVIENEELDRYSMAFDTMDKKTNDT